ncbi:MAG: hypothetical protein AAF721_15930 [Myxococcota bacterium]
MLSGLCVACLPAPKDGGEVQDSGADDGDDGGSTGDGSGDDGDDEGMPTSGDDDGTPTSEGDGETGTVPQSCADAGWDDSLASFEMLAADAGNTYWYTQQAGGMGFEVEACTYETQVEVVDGVLARRALSIIGTPDGVDPADCEVEEFEEVGDEINDNAPGFTFTAATMEDLYAGCCELLGLTPEEDFDKSFVVNDDGIATQCFAIMVNCGEGCAADVDGFSGFNLQDFQWGTPPQ